MSELITRIRADIEKDPYYKNFANDGERFLAWYLRNIYQRTAIEARQDITDGQNDKEIDAVIVDDEKRTSASAEPSNSPNCAAPLRSIPVSRLVSSGRQIVLSEH